MSYQHRVTSFPACLAIFILIQIGTFHNFINAQPRQNNPSVFERFWEIGCEFSGVVSRVRRSASNPQPEELNFDDPEELFKYLYPLADVKPGDENIGSQRSSSGTHSISSWLEDLMELWHSECQHRRRKRSAEKRNENPTPGNSWSSQSHRIRGRVDRKKLVSVMEGKNSSLGMSLSESLGNRRRDNDDENGIGDRQYQQQYGSGESPNGALHSYGTASMSNNDNYEDENYGKNENLEEDSYKDKDEEVDKDEKKFKPKPNKPKPEPEGSPIQPPAKEEIFFAQYGGDIEYFFPLLSFGIPFDGEITLLGFHGFRGIFPY